MPRLPRNPADPGQRFFAQINRFICECPKCGYLIHAYFDQKTRTLPRGGKPAPARSCVYNPLSSRLTCPQCRRTWGVGLLVYPVAQRVQSRQPADQRPTLEQLLTLRSYGGGWLSPTEIRGADEMNLVITAECVCPDVAGGLSMACPVHGWKATNELLEQTQPDKPDDPGEPE